jgi:beta-glucosidase
MNPGCNLENGSTARLAAAVAAAANADVIVAVVGQTRDQAGENLDRDNLDLVGGQEKLVEAMQATGKPVIVVLENGAPLTINWINDHVPAIVESWYARPVRRHGRRRGAVRQSESRRETPRLLPAQPRPDSLLLQPPALHRADWLLPIPQSPLYPFGFGLSYTTFDYSGLKIEPAVISPDQTATVSVSVRNTGARAGDEVVQLYIHQDFTSLKRPVKQLEGFQRVSLQPGETKTVRFTLSREQLRFWTNSGWTVEPGQIKVHVGASSQDIRQKGILVVK